MRSFPHLPWARSLWPLSPRLIAGALLVLSIAILGGAHFFERVVGLDPCPLCLEQRLPWWLLIALSGAMLALPYVPGWPGRSLIGLFGLAAALSLWSAWLGLFHAGVEWGWWLGPQACASGGIADGVPNFDPNQVKDCARAAWRFLGLSLAGYNVLASVLAAALAGWAAFQLFEVHRFMTRVTAFVRALLPQPKPGAARP